jgi:SAM-dependent methyltransferase
MDLFRWINRVNDAHPWSHNDHSHHWLLRQLPRRVTHSIDIGCGTGNLVRALASRSDHVIGIDVDPEMIAIARDLSTGYTNVEFQTAALTDMPSAGYNLVTAMAVVHHLDLSEALTAMRRLTKPGGELIIVGCYRSATASDYLIDLVAIPANLLAGLLKSRHASSARIAMSAPAVAAGTPFAEVRKAAADVLPGADVRRRLFWRYTLHYSAEPTVTSPTVEHSCNAVSSSGERRTAG